MGNWAVHHSLRYLWAQAVSRKGGYKPRFTWKKSILIFASLTLILLMCSLTVVRAGGYTLVLTFGGFGSGDGQLRMPNGVAVDSSGCVYVCDYQNNANCRIEKFDSSGNFIRQIGSCGTGLGQLKNPRSVVVYGSLLYVADQGNHRIDIFDLNGNYIESWSKSYLTNPYGIAVDTSGNVYVTDYTGTLYYPDVGYVLVFDPNGNLLRYWGTDAYHGGLFDYHAFGIAVSASGYVYVVDENNCIYKFDTQGNYISQWGIMGSGNGQFKQPVGVAVDNSGNVYVADSANGRVQKFDGNGNFITLIGNGQFLSAQWLAVDSSGNVYVSDSSDFRDNVKEFAYESRFASTLTPNNVRLIVGHSQQFTSVHGGVGPFTYSWTLNGVVAPGEPTTSTWTFTPTTAGIYTVKLDVKDSLNVHSISYATVVVDKPALQFIVHCPVNIMVTDASGNREGADAAGNTYNEITGASYTGAGSDPQAITLPGTNTGMYTLHIFATSNGPFTVTVDNTAVDGSTLGSATWTGTVSQGETGSGTFTVNSDGSVSNSGIFIAPEYFLGGLLAIAGCFAAFAGYKKWPQRRSP